MSQNLDLAKEIIKEQTHKEHKNITKKTIKKQCVTCNGYGMVKTEIEICNTCDGLKCVMCNSTGFSVLPYSDCGVCYRAGEIEIDIIVE